MKRIVWRIVLLLITIHVPGALFAQGYVGIYADPSGTVACTEIEQYTNKTLYVLGVLEDASASGVRGVEFRIEVSEPDGWSLSYTPPASATIVLGNPLDTHPDSSDGSGVILAFDTCQFDSSGIIPLGTISATNLSGEPTYLSTKRHSDPTNHEYECPLFILCDAPTFTQVCMEEVSASACSTLTTKPFVVQGVGERAVFTAGLDITELPGPEILEALLNPKRPISLTWRNPPADIVGEQPGYPEKSVGGATVAADTTWFASWSFDSGGCSDQGWEALDNRVHNLSTEDIPWAISSDYDGKSYDGVTIHGNAAVLSSFSSCWVDSGYGDEWDYAIQIEYQYPESGEARLKFNMLLDTSSPDGVVIEGDSLGHSQLINYDLLSSDSLYVRPRDLRVRLAEQPFIGLQRGVRVDVPLRDFGPGTHHALIRFVSDYDVSPVSNSGYTLGAGVVIDSLVVTGSTGFIEDFSGTLNSAVSFVISADNAGFGNWGRVFSAITDNVDCPDNLSCAWLFTAPGTLANVQSQAFGPNQYVIRNWLDDIIVSPWVTASQDAGRTVVEIRELGGNTYKQSRIARAMNIRGKTDEGCVSRWGDIESDIFTTASWYEKLDDYYWEVKVADISHFVASQDWDDVQLQYRVSDAQHILYGFVGPPSPFEPGPGPFVDDIRIGRIASTAPILSVGVGDDSKFLAQDRFADDESRYGTSSFSMAGDIAADQEGGVDPGDSIVVWVESPSGTVTEVLFYGAIVSGPHQGKAPPPYSVAGNGFFVVPADSARRASGSAVRGQFFVDLDDEYFRGGDVLQYFWRVTSTVGISSLPSGITDVPTSIAAAEELTGGLFEVNYLPVMDWAQSYLDSIASDPNGKREPTGTEIAQSTQRNCMLYVNQVNRRRRSGDLNRTSFMYTLDRLGYRDAYDVYDVNGEGNTYSELASRAVPLQAIGYSIIVHDAGPDHFAPLPDGQFESQWKVDQDGWYVQWLNLNHGANDPLLWLIGENLVETHSGSELLDFYMGATYLGGGVETNPDVAGVANMTFTVGSAAPLADDSFSLGGGCRADYDVLTTTGASGATITHRWGSISTDGAIVMRSDSGVPANMITMAFNWADIAFVQGDPSGELVQDILGAIQTCDGSGSTTSLAETSPRVSRLFQNYPNPANPMTSVSFDLAREGRVSLRIYDVRGRLVRSLVDEVLEPQHHTYVWDGRNDSGVHVSSGLYLYRIDSIGFSQSRKLVMVR